MNKDVFISYKSEEISTAYMVRDVLTTNGIGCWMAPESIEVGTDYADSIPRGIANCKVFVLLLSEKAQESPWVENELKEAITRKKVIIPFIIEECNIGMKFSFALGNAQRWEAYKEMSQSLEKLVKLIRGIVSVEGESEYAATINEDLLNEFETVRKGMEKSNYTAKRWIF